MFYKEQGKFEYNFCNFKNVERGIKKMDLKYQSRIKKILINLKI